MEEGTRGHGRATLGLVVLVACLTVACGPRSAPEDAAPSPVTTSEPVADPDAVQEAEATLRAFFAVKGRAEDPLSVRIDEQSVHLTARDVHPSAAYEAGMQDRPSGITDSTVSVDLSSPRWTGDTIRIDFDFHSTGVSYPMIGDRLQRDAGVPAKSHWAGTATLENQDGAWLIDDLTADSFGSAVG
ncbi:hypothetical protein [Nocardioides alpinus]|uniref:hypothetical protein n=1 Tax=Nocardioides alpinus TaxID=748909 RepID=UPI001114697A|nr:hypothetical protein [Nocardioides alpinus]